MVSKKVLIIGAGRSGFAAFELLKKHQISALLFDDHKGLLPEFDMQEISSVILSPGVEREHRLVKKALSFGIPILNEMDLAFKFLKPAMIIGITGTNGKSTTTKMLESMLNCVGRAKACGNLGLPLCEIALNDETYDFLVVEISSFQLETLHLLRLDHALLLNITPDHLDRYQSFAEYKDAKLKITSLLKPTGKLFANLDLSPINFKNVSYFSLKDDQAFLVKDVFGSHNQENAWGAAQVAKILGLSDEQILSGLKNFEPLPHRCEFIGTHNGVSYINDSKGTTVVAVMRALEMINSPVHLLLGGIEKGEDFSKLHKKYFPHIAGFYIFGQAKEKIAQALNEENTFADLKSAMMEANMRAKAGDTILLSPGCASYDQFDNYIHRGEVFKEIFAKLKAKEGLKKCT